MSTFTHEQIIAHVTAWYGRIHPERVLPDMRSEAEMNKRVMEIALTALKATAPVTIPPHVLDAMSEMCDGGFDAQGIWDLCRQEFALAALNEPQQCAHVNMDCDDGQARCLGCGKFWEV